MTVVINIGLFIINNKGYRCFVLDNSSRGVKAWEKNDKDNNNINAG